MKFLSLIVMVCLATCAVGFPAEDSVVFKEMLRSFDGIGENMIDDGGIPPRTEDKGDDIPPKPEDEDDTPPRPEDEEEAENMIAGPDFDDEDLEEDVQAQRVHTRSLELGKKKYTTADKVTLFWNDSTPFTKTVQQLSLPCHNKYRALHKNTPKLGWDTQLSQQSADYAYQMLDKPAAVHSAGASTGEYGENIMEGLNCYDVVYIPTQACRNWYRESGPDSDPYDYSANYHMDHRAHFVQMIWKDSDVVGCGMATNHYQDPAYPAYYGIYCTRTVIVCRYKDLDAGTGSYTQNVLPLKSGKACDNPFTSNQLVPNNGGNCVDYSEKCKDYKSMCGPNIGENCGCACPEGLKLY